MRIGIIGAGASGMAAALAAAENPCHQVVVLERQARVGRKLQATGNGRCNLTNLHAQADSYHGSMPEFARYALASFGPEQTRQWFAQMGLFTVAEASGRVYPYSDQANSVVDVLRFALAQAGVQLALDCEVTKLRRTADGFLVEGAGQAVFDRVIVACGGLAGTKLGGSLGGYKLLRSLGHQVTKLRPALVQLRTSWDGVTALKGVRANCRAAIYQDQREICASCGEIQFTEYGLSGPVIFEISRDACQGSGAWNCRIDFLPDYQSSVLLAELQRRQGTDLPVGELLTGILHNRLGRVITKRAGLRLDIPIAALSSETLTALSRLVKDFWVPLSEPMGMDCAQVTAGGVVTEEFDPTTMESRLIPGLFACGEVLDIDGDCGGYNLQWAWSSGRLAGLSAGREKP